LARPFSGQLRHAFPLFVFVARWECAFRIDFCNINTAITPTGRTAIRIPDTVARKIAGEFA